MKLKLGLLFTITALIAPLLAAPVAEASSGSICEAGLPGSHRVTGAATFWATSHNFGGRNPCDRWFVISWGPKKNAGSDWSTIYVAPGHKFNTKWKISGRGVGFGGYLVDGEPNFCSAENMNYTVGVDGKNTVVEYSNC